MKMKKPDIKLIETDAFPFEFLSQIGERESWRKEIHRPIYHIHKWWAKRLGSIFRGILLGCKIGEKSELRKEFYRTHAFTSETVFDPFMGSGTTVGEAHKLGFTALGRDINPVAVDAVRVALGPIDWDAIEDAYKRLADGVGERIRTLYRSKDSRGHRCDVLYYFWVMQAGCPGCSKSVDLFTSYVIAKNAYPKRKPEVRIVCPTCGDIFDGTYGRRSAACTACSHAFNPDQGTAKGQKATCPHCGKLFAIMKAVSTSGGRPNFRLYAKLVLTRDGEKEYLRATEEDYAAYRDCSTALQEEMQLGNIKLPSLTLEDGYNTRQAIGYNFRSWRDFFNDRQLLALGWLQAAIDKVDDVPSRETLLMLFSGVLEFNNLFASYKGEGTGAVRHMFSHHILKPERTPIEANVWGMPKSSGAFSGLFKTRLRRAVEYRQVPTEVNGQDSEKGVVCSPPFTGEVRNWPVGAALSPRAVYLSCGDSSATGLPDRSIDLVVTDPPFFDNVHYSELADFFYAWQQLMKGGKKDTTTRHKAEVQDTEPKNFARKLQAVFRECHRVLRDSGLLVFTYHHSRDDGWSAVADAVLGAGFVVVNSQPVKSEMSVATPKSAAKEPIQFDIVVVCRRAGTGRSPATVKDALESARAKLTRLEEAGFTLSRNDRKIVLYGQMLPTLTSTADTERIAKYVEDELTSAVPALQKHRLVQGIG